MAYNDLVQDHFNNPRNIGSLDKNDPNVGTAVVGAPACGDVLKFQIKVNKESNVIEEVACKTFGCGSAIASSSYLSEKIKGKTIEEASKIKNVEIAEALSLPPVKIHCSILAEDAIKEALLDYQKKQEKNN